MKIHACIITRDSEKTLGKMLDSIEPHVDTIHILDTGSKKENKKATDSINPKDNPEFYINVDGQELLRFAKARNRSFEPYNVDNGDWILWVDSDDELVVKRSLKEILEIADKNGVNAVTCMYNYKMDGDEVKTGHTKHRLVRAGQYQWEHDDELWVVHENLYPKKGYKEYAMYTDQIEVNHRNPDFKKSADRNHKLLAHMATTMPNDPKVWYLLGRDSLGAKKTDIGMVALEKALKMDLNDHDRKSANLFLAEMYESSGSYKLALDYAMDALTVDPLSPETNSFVAKYYLLLGMNKEAVGFALRSNEGNFDTMGGAEVMPYDIMKQNAYVLAEALDRLGMYEDAINVLKDLSKITRKSDEKVLAESIKETQGKIQDRRITTLFKQTAELLHAQGKDPYKALEMLPERGFPIKAEIELRRSLGDFKVHDRAVDFYCLNNFEKWDPGTIITKGGGGSETAVVELAKRFAKAGYTVTVWGNPVEDGSVFDGVTWRSVLEFPYQDKFDILISWRNVQVFKDYDLEANYKYLWLQDIMQPFDYTKDVIEKIDKIIVLSTYHRFTAPAVPSDKFYFTTNGIDVDLIKEVEAEVGEIERVKGYCVNASSADRGLEELVGMWGDVIKEAPHATLSWFYGWNSWNVFANNEAAGKLKKSLIKQMKKKGINEGGRVGKKELYKEYLKAQFQTYPYKPPAETSCISVMEAQALGAIPITTGLDALEETQQFGIKVPITEYKDTLIRMLNSDDNTDEYRQQMMDWARDKFSWDRVADQWIQDLFYGYLTDKKD